MVSGIAKLFPIWAFEKQLVDLGITSWCYAPYLARFIIAFEISIGISILQPYYLKKIVIPATILLLLAFCIHLSVEMYQHGAMSGNCGCFGQLIPMTPLEAFIKNIVTIFLLIYLFKTVESKEKDRSKSIYLFFIYLASALVLFVFFPFCPCKDSETVNQTLNTSDTIKQNVISPDSTVYEISNTKSSDSSAKNIKPAKKNNSVIKPENGSKKTKSRYSQYTTFGNKTVNLDEGKKIICFFAAGCDHCRNTAKEIYLLSKKIDLPPVYVFFMNEETELIPDFFKEANCNFPYTILEVPVFWELLGTNADTPGVILLWNGNIIRFYEGLDNNKFDPVDFEQTCKSSDFF